jgi:hypothetical protein
VRTRTRTRARVARIERDAKSLTTLTTTDRRTSRERFCCSRGRYFRRFVAVARLMSSIFLTALFSAARSLKWPLFFISHGSLNAGDSRGYRRDSLQSHSLGARAPDILSDNPGHLQTETDTENAVISNS